MLPGGRDRSFVAGLNTQKSVYVQDCNTAKTDAIFKIIQEVWLIVLNITDIVKVGQYILSDCDHDTRIRTAIANRCFSATLAEIETSVTTSDISDNIVGLKCLPSDVLLTSFEYLDRPSLGSIAQVCSRFRDISYSDSLWHPGRPWQLIS